MLLLSAILKSSERFDYMHNLRRNLFFLACHKKNSRESHIIKENYMTLSVNEVFIHWNISDDAATKLKRTIRSISPIDFHKRYLKTGVCKIGFKSEIWLRKGYLVIKFVLQFLHFISKMFHCLQYSISTRYVP